MNKRPVWILPILIFSQFAGTSLWFAGNAIISDLQIHWNLDPASIGYVTSSVQFGFIAGTLCFAFFAISDLFSPLLFEVQVLIFFPILIIWGITAAGDSPQFSTLTAHTALKEYVGSVLTIVTSIGFFITIFSIEFANYMLGFIDPKFVFILLMPGSIVGLIYFWPLYKKQLLVKR